MNVPLEVSGRPLGHRLCHTPSTELAASFSERQIEARNEFLKRISTATWKQVERPCQLCGGHSFALLAETERHGLPVRTVLCNACSLVQTCPVLMESNYNDYYANIYRRLYDPSGVPTTEFFDDQARRGRALARLLTRSGIAPTDQVVEIGVGAGGVLAGFIEEGFSGFGCDFGEEFLEFGRAKGLDLRLGGIETLPDSCADVVVYSHVLEHVYDLRRELDHVRRILKPGGCLVVEVPGLFAVHRTYGADLLDYFQAAHLYYFSGKTLRDVLGVCGFDQVSSNYLVQGVFRAREAFDAETTHTLPRVRSSLPLVTIFYLRCCVLARPVVQRVHASLVGLVTARRRESTKC